MIKFISKYSFLLLSGVLLLYSSIVFSQNTAKVHGVLTDASNAPIQDVTISIIGVSKLPIYSDEKGKYEIIIPADTTITIVFQSLSFNLEKRPIKLAAGEKLVLNLKLKLSNKLTEVVITDETRFHQVVRIDPLDVEKLPTSSQDFNAILFTLPGVSSRNELSSTYSVRGGNFDENLIYVNGIEIYRPFLIRSGQQEGLSFINSDMVSSVKFSAGGFEAKYGDKMSSVLDVKYRKPRKFAGTVSGSLLGSSLHLEGASKNYRFTWLFGTRYKTNQYLLNGLNTQGEYRPFFADAQAFVTYDVTNKWELQLLGNFSTNKYQVVPESRETQFGTLNEALRLKIYFEGQEVDRFTTTMGALSAVRSFKNLNLRFTGSVFSTVESESFDILGQYYLSEVETDFSSSSFGDSATNIGVGSFLNNARTSLDARVISGVHNGSYGESGNELLWGVNYSNENINDKLSEWQYIDSAGYSLPITDPQTIVLQDVIKQKINISSNRVSGYIQKTWKRETTDTSTIYLIGGLRGNYWDFNKQGLLGPRASVAFKPNWKKDFLFKFSAGYYYQPPFYRELRDANGNINNNIKAQTSIHYVLTSDYNFKAWDRPFKFIVEGYYKSLKNLIPYEVDNVRITYSARNNAKGYATGVDLKINGEFIKGLESWASISFLQTREDIIDDYYYEYFNSDGEKIVSGSTNNNVAVDSNRIEPGYLPRPTDQRLNFNLFFQDNMPKVPDMKLHLNLVFGTGVPFGPPNSQRYQQTLRMPAYRRVDIGFSYEALKESKKRDRKKLASHLNSVWFSLEVFNLLGTNNTVSYIWVEDVTNRKYAVPNFLTNRQLNVRMVVKF